MLMRQLKTAELVEHLQDTLSEIEEARDWHLASRNILKQATSFRISWLQSSAKQRSRTRPHVCGTGKEHDTPREQRRNARLIRRVNDKLRSTV
jgi:hypothetical protein